MQHFPRTTLKIATRSSLLALWQSNYIADLIRQVAPHVSVELVHISTTGDRDQTETLRALGSFGVFTREVQVAILDGRADLAVHSLKDLPTDGPAELTLAATPVRGLTHDALILPTGSMGRTLADVPTGARIGTGSPRRQAQLRFLRPDLSLSEIRGNLDTRLKKLDSGEYDAIVLAAAGLTRLGWENRIQSEIAPPDMYPAVGQGAVGVECRTDDSDLRSLLMRVTDGPTWSSVTAERSLLSTLRAGCHAPLGVRTQVVGNALQLEAVVLPLDGHRRWMAHASADVSKAKELGQTVAGLLVSQGVERILHASL
ncbi:hydroxymethylbilane synthase [Schlesneria paludicola]|uniref:hydroxymethylbilane synthase n=1 Tax=Schlesneria paludicola TaxID=360056 RepID=UPI00029A130B|nr:hydroxymethylbilane synthase [Schlesneria paludicola]